MPIVKYGQIEERGSVFVDIQSDIPSSGEIVVSIEKFLNNVDAVRNRQVGWGIRLNGDDEPSSLLPWLNTINLIEVNFPKFSDGRGYSVAQVLRRRLGYQGELRAVGDIAFDQINYLYRCGFDAVELDSVEISQVGEALERFTSVYQPAADQSVPIFQKRFSGRTVDAVH